MRLIAGIIVVLMQAVGLTTHMSANFRARLSNQISPVSAKATPPRITAYSPPPLPIKHGQTSLHIESATAIAVDAQTMQVLYASNIGTKRPIASVTKLATALVILAGHNPTELVTVPELPRYNPDDALLGLHTGQTFLLSDLMQALLISSADDAADTLAIWDAGSQSAFATKMNRLVDTWQLGEMHFTNASGLGDENNYATALSLSRLASLAIANTTIRNIVARSSATITDKAGQSYSIHSTDDLLANSSFHGIKTGYTAAAGGCFIGLVTVNGHDVITVVLGADDRFADTTKLVNWIGVNWQWQ